MADQSDHDAITVYVDEETGNILRMLQSAIADEVSFALQSAELPDRLAIEHAVDLVRTHIEHLETTTIRALDARVSALAEGSENVRREIGARLAVTEVANSELRDVVRQAAEELRGQTSAHREHMNLEMAAARAELMSVRNDVEKIRSDLHGMSSALGRLAEVVNEVAAARDTLGRVPGFVIWLLGDRATLKLMRRSRAHHSSEKGSDLDRPHLLT